MTILSKERIYEVIRGPHITEKSTLISDDNTIAFKVSTDAKKSEIKSAIEFLFSVKVKRVNCSVIKGKIKKFKNITGRRNKLKKAMVTLKEGHSIDLTTGI